MIAKLLEPFYKQFPDYKVIYVTLSGSRLYGTKNSNSDKDYKGIFIPSKESLLLKTDAEHYTTTTGNNKSRNDLEDIDIQLWSIHKFLHLLKKGETGALDLLFSMQHKDTQLLYTKQSEEILKELPNLLHSNVHAFLGYAIGQSKRYNVKGKRYKELLNFLEQIKEYPNTSLETIIANNTYSYIKIIQAKNTKNNTKGNTTYLSVLGKLFDISLDRDYIISRLQLIKTQYGNRTKNAVTSIDYKALSHAVRVLFEVRELLTVNTITFPLLDRTYIKSIKEGNEQLEDVMEVILTTIEEVDNLVKSTTLPAKADSKVYKQLLLKLL